MQGLDDKNFKANEKYSLKSFITLKNLQENEYFKNFISDIDDNDYDYWTIKELNYFDYSDNYDKLLKNFEPLLGHYEGDSFCGADDADDDYSDEFDNIRNFYDYILEDEKYYINYIYNII